MHRKEGMAGHEHGAQQALQSAVGPRALRFLRTRATGEAARIKLGPTKVAYPAASLWPPLLSYGKSDTAFKLS